MDLYAKLASNMEELAGNFEAKFQQMEGDIQRLASTEHGSSQAPGTPHKDWQSLSREFRDFKMLTWKSLAMMRSQMELLVQGLDRQETASRRKILLFHGIPESSVSSVESLVMDLLTSQFKMSDIAPELLASCYRLGSNSSKPRPILVRFSSHQLRSQVWNAKTSLKGSDVAVSEFLTKPRHDVFMAARKHFGIRQCWTSEGRIIIALPDNKRRKIEAMSELKPLLAEFPAHKSSQEKAPSASRAKGKPSSVPAAKPGPSKPEAKSKRLR